MSPKDPNEIFEWGEVVARPCKAIALDWDSQDLRDGDLKDVLDAVPPARGVYAIEGCHDASPGGGILYIGQTGGAIARTLPERLPGSLGTVWRKCSKSDDRMRLHSDVWNVIVRWAVIQQADLVLSLV